MEVILKDYLVVDAALLTVFAPVVASTGGLYQDQNTCGSILSLDAYAGYLTCQLELQRVQVGAANDG